MNEIGKNMQAGQAGDLLFHAGTRSQTSYQLTGQEVEY